MFVAATACAGRHTDHRARAYDRLHSVSTKSKRSGFDQEEPRAVRLPFNLQSFRQDVDQTLPKHFTPQADQMLRNVGSRLAQCWTKLTNLTNLKNVETLDCQILQNLA